MVIKTLSAMEHLSSPISDPNEATLPAAVLFVDDEPNILSSLRRLFRPQGYRIFIGESAAAGLEILEREPIDLVISDMRMPEVDGAQFLGQVRARWPKAVRILLTGYADIGSTINAINCGEIYRYITKPWDDNDIILTVREALERRRLETENLRLAELTHRQNEELKSLNQGLEAKVAERTSELSQTMSFLEVANQQLRKTLLTTVRVLSGLTEMRGGPLTGHSRRVAEHSRTIAGRLNLDEGQIQDIVMAALLHDIGKIAFPDRIVEKPFNSLSQEERALVIKHPVQGALALMEIEQLRTPALIIRHHHECFDGSGFPDRLRGYAIPLGARILAVANDFDSLQRGTLANRRLSATEARTFLLDNRGKRYDPEVLDAFDGALKLTLDKEKPREVSRQIYQLQPGMVLAQDLFNHDKYLLLSKGFVLTAVVIEQLFKLETSSEGRHLTAMVLPESIPIPPQVQ